MHCVEWIQKILVGGAIWNEVKCLLEAYCTYKNGRRRADARAVDLEGQAFIRGSQNLKLRTKAVVFKRESL